MWISLNQLQTVVSIFQLLASVSLSDCKFQSYLKPWQAPIQAFAFAINLILLVPFSFFTAASVSLVMKEHLQTLHNGPHLLSLLHNVNCLCLKVVFPSDLYKRSPSRFGFRERLKFKTNREEKEPKTNGQRWRKCWAGGEIGGHWYFWSKRLSIIFGGGPNNGVGRTGWLQTAGDWTQRRNRSADRWLHMGQQTGTAFVFSPNQTGVTSSFCFPQIHLNQSLMNRLKPQWIPARGLQGLPQYKTSLGENSTKLDFFFSSFGFLSGQPQPNSQSIDSVVDLSVIG